jgi:hypothetical protein
VIAPFHACLYATDGKSHNNLNISKYVWGDSGKPGDATAIDGTDHSTPVTAHSVCDLQGRETNLQPSTFNVQSSMLKKGIYIIGGQKIVVK